MTDVPYNTSADARALIAEGKKHEAATTDAGSIARIAWLRTNLAALLTGYTAALDEVDRQVAERELDTREALVENGQLRERLTRHDAQAELVQDRMAGLERRWRQQAEEIANVVIAMIARIRELERTVGQAADLLEAKSDGLARREWAKAIRRYVANGGER